MARYSRRRFLEDSLLAAATLAAVPAGRALAAEDKKSKGPNEKLAVAVVGVRGRGGDHLNAFSKHPDTEVTRDYRAPFVVPKAGEV